MNISEQIRHLCKEKNAIIMAHYYTSDEIQDIADYIGDSLALAKKAKDTDANIIVMCGVNFMGETAKIICPDKKVLVPDKNAGCSLADSCEAEALKKVKEKHPDYTVISYVNTSVRVKALTDIVVTSSNALQIVEQLPKEEKILFGPDKNLGSYINKMSGRDMLLWDGACHVHSRFSFDEIAHLKTQYPNAIVLAHPECNSDILSLADVIGSTNMLLEYAVKHENKQYIVVTEKGILHEMQKMCPDKQFICPDNACEYMKLCTLDKIYDCLSNETNEIIIDGNILKKAILPIDRMLQMS